MVRLSPHRLGNKVGKKGIVHYLIHHVLDDRVYVVLDLLESLHDNGVIDFTEHRNLLIAFPLDL